MPVHWYFTSALPRSLLFAFPLSFVGPYLDRRLIRVMVVAMVYVILYSRLSHKEVPPDSCFTKNTLKVRFLFPVLPLFNLSSAVAFVRFQRNKRKNWLSACAFYGCVCGYLLSISVTMLMLWASVWNYPGGHALQSLHAHNHYSNFYHTGDCIHDEISVHIGTLPAMTGISRFLELHHCWSYSKAITQ